MSITNDLHKPVSKESFPDMRSRLLLGHRNRKCIRRRRGKHRDWEIFNVPEKGFFALFLLCIGSKRKDNPYLQGP